MIRSRLPAYLRRSLPIVLALGMVGCGKNTPLPIPQLFKGKGSIDPYTVFQKVKVKRLLKVTSPDIGAGQPIPDRFSDYDGGETPTINWSDPPAGTKSVVVIIEDPDAHGEYPFVHWITYNIKPSDTSVGSALLIGVLQGLNTSGTTTYFGMRPPRGDQPHNYHFEVFALDADRLLPLNADRNAVIRAATRHTLAKGELVAPYQKL